MALTRTRPHLRKLRGLGPHSSNSIRSGTSRGVEKQKNEKRQKKYNYTPKTREQKFSNNNPRKNTKHKPIRGGKRREQIKEKRYHDTYYLVYRKTKLHKRENERSPRYAKLRHLEGQLRNIQNSQDFSSLKRAEKILEIHKNSKKRPQ